MVFLIQNLKLGFLLVFLKNKFNIFYRGFFLLKIPNEWRLILNTPFSKLFSAITKNKASNQYKLFSLEISKLSNGFQKFINTFSRLEINSTYECFSREVILEEFEAYFEVLEIGVFHEMLR